MNPSAELLNSLRACANKNTAIAAEARRQLTSVVAESLQERFDTRFDRENRAAALALPLKQGIFKGDIISTIFKAEKFEAGQTPEWPMDFVNPGSEKDYVAYTMPSHGRIPQRNVEGDYIQASTYNVSASIDFNLDYLRDARWDIVRRAMEALDASLVKKLNDDGWHTILGAAYDRNVMVYDSDAAQGQFTKRLVSLMKTELRRRAGGNSTSLNRGRLTDLYLSPEAIEDMRNWGVDQVDEVTRREIYVAGDGTLNRIFQVNLHDLDELGVAQEYQLYFTGVLGGSLQASDVELVIGLDLSHDDTFIMPWREGWQVFEDPYLHREWRMGWYGRMTVGFACLDSRRILAGSF